MSGSHTPTGFWQSTAARVLEGARLVRTGGWRLGLVLLITQLIIVVVCLPIMQWLFREALRAAGMTGLDLGQLQITGGIPFTLGLIVCICVIALWLLSLQLTAIMVTLESVRVGGRGTVQELWAAITQVMRKLLSPSSLPLLGYLFLVLPLAGFGFLSVLTQGISIPKFVSGELMKSTSGIVILAILLITIGTINLRLSLTLPVFALTDASGRQATRTSRRLTRGKTDLSIIVGVLAIAAVTTVIAALLVAVALLPTAVSDLVMPVASPGVAAFSLGTAQVAGAALTGLTTAWLAGFLIATLAANRDEVPHSWVATGPGDGTHATPQRSARAWVLGSIVVLAILLGTAQLGTMQRISHQPDTLALGHRGFTVAAVENTIESLEAAAEAGIDLVEMDVMQTADGAFIAMHDTNLSRLAGVPAEVKDLTFTELTALTVRDRAGNEGLIPSFEDYVVRAAELELPLLIEIKLSGAETDDHVDLLVAELEALDLLDRNIYHSLDAASVTRLKELRTDLSVGYTMAFAAQDAPDTPADFIVVEQWTASEGMHEAARRAGLGFWVWTVNDEPAIRDYLRTGTDGIVSDRPDLVMQHRAEIVTETGLASFLFDALQRWITVF